MPAGGEGAALEFYAGVLGLSPVPKPAALAGRGGVWFEGPGLRLHLGVETPFRAARTAHPAFEIAGLERAAAALEAAGCPVRRDAGLPGIRRFFTEDPFGNRIELLERL